MLTRQRAFAAFLGLLIAIGLIAVYSSDVFAEPGVEDGLIDADLGDGGKGITHPVLGSQLSWLADQAAAAELGGEAATSPVPGDSGNGTDVRNYAIEMIGLSIMFDGDSDDAVQAIRDIGGDVRNIFDGYIEAYVPIAALADLAKVKGLTWARQLAKPVRDKGQVTSGGVAAHFADTWHREGITGAGVKVGVIDLSTTYTSKDGFSGLKKLMGSDIPATVIGRCYEDHGKPTDNLDNCATAGDGHGTLVAETLMDVAPDASLYISNPSTIGDLYTAVQWMQQQGVRVIVHSVGWTYWGPGDGTSPYAFSPLNTVKWAADNGIVWINSGGNYNRKTWYGTFNDADSDNIHEWVTGDEYQEFHLNARESIIFFMRWDDVWGGAAGATKDLDLILVKNPGAFETVITSVGGRDRQAGAPQDIPFEFLNFKAPAGGTYAVKVKKHSGTTPSWIQFASFTTTLPHRTTGHSVLDPAGSNHAGMMAVGAASTATGDIHSYSSRGPTPDGRIKPDIVGASGHRTTSGTKWGTSLAAPHVAGLAALVRQQNPTFTPEQTTAYLKAHAHQRGSPVPNNTWGHGFAQLPSLACHSYLNGDGSTSGSWTSSCASAPRNSVFSWSHYYTFTIAQQSTITMTLSSTLSTYLYLRASANNRLGDVLYDDYDSGFSLSAEISESLAPGTYTIEANTSYPPQRGDYTLTVSGGLVTLPEVSVSTGGDITEGTNAVFTFTANPAPSANLDVTVRVATEGEYGVSPGDRTVTIPASGSATLSLATSDDSIEEFHGSVTASIARNPAYHVSDTSRSATIAIADDEGGDPCADPIAADGQFTGSLDGSCKSIERVRSFGQTANARFFTITTTEPRAVTFELRVTNASPPNQAIPALLSLREGDQSGTGTLLSEAEGTTAKFQRVLLPGTYNLEVGPYAYTSTGNYTLKVTGLTSYPSEPVIAVVPGPEVIEGGSVNFTVYAVPAPTSDLVVPINVGQLGDFAYSPNEETTTVTVGTSGQATLSYATTADTAAEDDGWVIATAQSGSGYTLASAQGSAVVIVSDDDGEAPCGLALSGNGSVSGKWRTSCQSQIASRPNHFSRYYTFTMSTSGTVTIDLTGVKPRTTDTYLALRSGAYDPNASSAAYLDYDDDSGEYLDARIVREVDAGTYTIEATHDQAQRTGRFTLSIKGMPDGVTDPEISIAAAKDITEGETATFYVSANPKPTAHLEVTVDVTQVGDFGVSTGQRQVTIGTGGTNTLIVSTADDSVGEGDGSISAAVVDGAGYTVSASQGSASAAVADNDGGAGCSSLLTGNGSVNGAWDSSCESTARSGRYARFYAFYVSSDSNVTIRLESAEDNYLFLRTGKHTLSGTAIDENDDKQLPSTNAGIDATLTAGWYTIEATTFDVATTDTFTLTVSGLSAQQTEPEVSIAASASTVIEGSDATFTITANPAPAANLDVSVTISQDGDFGVAPASHTVSIPASGTVSLTISTTGDSTDEANGSVTAAINAGTGYTVSTSAGAATVTIADDDGSPPALTCDTSDTVIADGITTARAAYDWHVDNNGSSEALFWRILNTFGAANMPTKPSGVTTETVTLSEIQTFSNGKSWSGWQTIIDALQQCSTSPNAVTDPEVSIAANGTVTEGGDATFTVTADPAPSADLAVTIAVTVSGDYGVAAQSHTVTIPTSGSATLTISTTGDSLDEADGSVTASINAGTGYTVSSTAGAATVAVQDDDVPEVSITAGGTITEGGDVTFTVSASPAPAVALDVTVAITQTGDFGVSPGTQSVTIPTTGSATLAVSTTGDSVDEANGSVTATVTSGAGYTVSASSGLATVAVEDDDHPPATCDKTDSTIADGITTARAAYDWHIDNNGGDEALFWRILNTLGADIMPTKPSGVTTDTVTSTEVTTFSDGRGWSGWQKIIDALEACGTPSPPPPLAVPEISIAAGPNITEGGDATFTVSASPAPTSAWSVVVSVTQLGDFGVSTGQRQVTISSSGTGTLTVNTTNDSSDEPNGSVSATVNSGQGYTVSATAGTATVSVADDDDAVSATPVVSITAGGGITEGGNATFTLTATPAPASALSVSVTVGQTGDYATVGPRTVSIPTSGSATFTVGTLNDSVDEPNGSITATINGGQGYSWSSAAGTATVAVADDDDPPPSTPVVSVTAGGGITEGGDATFTLTATPTPASALSVSVTVGQTGDYASVGPRTVTIPMSGSATFTVATLNDSVDEPDGSVGATVNSGQGYSVSATAGSGTVSVADNDVPEVSVSAGAGITEGGDAVFTLTADPAPHAPLTVTVNLSQSGNFGVTPGTRTITIPTSGSATLTVSTTDDSADEANGSVTAAISNGTGYVVSGTASSATVTVADDDPTPVNTTPTLTISDASGSEGTSLVFTVTLSPSSNRYAWVHYYARPNLWPDVSATYADFGSAYGLLTFKPGETVQTITVPLVDDSVAEGTETFALVLYSAAQATIGDGEGTGTITDND